MKIIVTRVLFDVCVLDHIKLKVFRVVKASGKVLFPREEAFCLVDRLNVGSVADFDIH